MTPIRAFKIGGSYQAAGWIVSIFQTTNGEQRLVFEFDEPKGMLHIFNNSQITLQNPTDQSRKDFTP